jgi:flagellar motor switch protein FliG
LDASRLISFIAKEHPQTIALILSQLPARLAAGVLNGLPAEMQVDVAYRTATMDNIPISRLHKLEMSLMESLKPAIFGITEVGGPKAVVDILNCTGRSTEKAVLEQLDDKDAELAETVRNQMFVFDDIANLTDRDIQTILREVDTKDLAVGLKGGSEKLQNRIFKNVSDRVAALIKLEMQYSGPTRMSDVEEVQLRIMKTVRQLEKSGSITIVRGDSGDVYV